MGAQPVGSPDSVRISFPRCFSHSELFLWKAGKSFRLTLMKAISWQLAVSAGTVRLTSPLNVSAYGLNETGPHAQFCTIVFLFSVLHPGTVRILKLNVMFWGQG